MSGRDYDARWEQLAADGHNPHGEADFVDQLLGGSGRVLDAGCGTGRVAIELARRGYQVVGVDIDTEMIAQARAKALQLVWYQLDLSTFDLGEGFDAVVMAGNVLLFTVPGTEAAVVARCAAHLSPGGALVAGFQLRTGGYGLDQYDTDCTAAELTLKQRFSTWERAPWNGGNYAVSVHIHRHRSDS
ncbi:class I SAM-dependent methyltransferase [Candidatus Poriferisocius sp.]|uniref:class I SAM-dependent methyltransferase n=1 Tax=Candidatus Poriferisocius sp. TaxID=3101276 RepID=UPI003B029CF8